LQLFDDGVWLDFIRIREGKRPTYPEALDMAEIQLAWWSEIHGAAKT
jgi:hypothetical protein